MTTTVEHATLTGADLHVPKTAAPSLTLGTANAAGSGATALDSDATIAAFDTTAPVTQAFGDAAATGSAAVAARRDHKHGMPSDPTGLPLALTGATAATRYVGGTASGAPASGTFAVGDFVIAQNGHVWVCTVAGSPGTWTDISGGSGSSPLTTKGDLYGYDTADARIPIGADGTVLTADSTQAPGLKWGTAGGFTPAVGKVARTAGNYTTTSTSFVDVDTTNVVLTLTTGAHRVLLGCAFATQNNTNARDNQFDYTVDGTRQGNSTGLYQIFVGTSGNNYGVSVTYLTDVLSAGSHTFRLQWRVNSASTATILADGTSGTLYFWAVEQAA